jgi:hypothetical protein
MVSSNGVVFQKMNFLTKTNKENVGKNGTCLEVFDKLVPVVAGAVTVAANVLYVDTVLSEVKKLKVKS